MKPLAGPLEDLLADGRCRISWLPLRRVYVERTAGSLPPRRFRATAGEGVIERIVAPLGRRIYESSPLVDARLKDASRVTRFRRSR